MTGCHVLSCIFSIPITSSYLIVIGGGLVGKKIFSMSLLHIGFAHLHFYAVNRISFTGYNIDCNICLLLAPRSPYQPIPKDGHLLFPL